MKTKHTNRIASPRYPSSYADSRDMFTLLGHDGESHWPDIGVAATVIQGITVWVEPIQRREDGRKSSKHRVKFKCPNCREIFSVGRMHQHECEFTDDTRKAEIDRHFGQPHYGHDERDDVHPADDKTNQREPY